MISIQRLSHDSSWYIDWQGTKLVVDPWLMGSEVDGFNWLNEQWHKEDPVAIDQLPPYNAVLVSQSYEDHCHTETIKHLDQTKSLLATTKAFKKLRKSFPERTIEHLETNKKVSFGQLHFYSFSPGRLLDPIYYAVLIANSDNEAIFYAPHGFELKPSQLAIASKYEIKLLITTFTEFDLPALLGGKVNPGLPNVRELKKQLNPDTVLNTHDEEKIMKGLVAKNAKIKYADYQALESSGELNFQYISNYQPIKID